MDLAIGQNMFCLDVRYRSQVAAIRAWPTEPDEIGFLIGHLKAGDVFFDLGSNWGLYTAIASSLVGQDGLVVAVEMNPMPFSRLMKLVRASVTNVLALNVALSNVSGDLVSINNPWYRNDTGGFLSPSKSNDRFTTRSLDDLWKQLGCPRVRMAKLDVEGFEPLVIAGGKQFLKEGVGGFLLAEVSDWTKSRTGVEYTKIYSDLLECGFSSAYRFIDGKLTRISWEENPLPVNSNVLFAKEEIA